MKRCQGPLNTGAGGHLHGTMAARGTEPGQRWSGSSRLHWSLAPFHAGQDRDMCWGISIGCSQGEMEDRSNHGDGRNSHSLS